MTVKNTVLNAAASELCTLYLKRKARLSNGIRLMTCQICHGVAKLGAVSVRK
jgi:hypothetical protein